MRLSVSLMLSIGLPHLNDLAFEPAFYAMSLRRWGYSTVREAITRPAWNVVTISRQLSSSCPRRLWLTVYGGLMRRRYARWGEPVGRNWWSPESDFTLCFFTLLNWLNRLKAPT